MDKLSNNSRAYITYTDSATKSSKHYYNVVEILRRLRGHEIISIDRSNHWGYSEANVDITKITGLRTSTSITEARAHAPSGLALHISLQEHIAFSIDHNIWRPFREFNRDHLILHNNRCTMPILFTPIRLITIYIVIFQLALETASNTTWLVEYTHSALLFSEKYLISRQLLKDVPS